MLVCIGHQIEMSSAPALDVYVSDIPDHTTPLLETGFLTKNAVMMVTTAIDRLGTTKVEVIGKNGGIRSRRQVQILGAFTELNRTTKSSALSGEIALGGFDMELGSDKNYNHIALDLAMSENSRLVPQTSTGVSIQINGKTGKSKITYDKGGDFGVIAAGGFTAQEGFHSAERLLVETSVALMMSKYFNIDMQGCLDSARRQVSPPTEIAYDQPIFRQQQVAQYATPAERTVIRRPSLQIINTPVTQQDIIRW